MADIEALLAQLPPEYLGWMADRYVAVAGVTRDEALTMARVMVEVVDDLDACGVSEVCAHVLADEDMSEWGSG